MSATPIIKPGLPSRRTGPAACLPIWDALCATDPSISGIKTINRWLSSLKREDRILFVRRYWYGDSIKELAAECRTSPNQMSGRLFRLRKKLKAALEREGITL
ncbi:MAG: RNA polymerase sigma factor [Lachnospiraceae bacterium]